MYIPKNILGHVSHDRMIQKINTISLHYVIQKHYSNLPNLTLIIKPIK